MRAACCFSGGKDSTLAAHVLDQFYDVTLVTGTFGVTDDWENARAAAEATGFAFESVDLDRDIAVEAVERMREDGFPRNGIQHVHEHMLETIAELNVDAVADGTRRDDRVPTVSRAMAQSLEDRHDVDYLAPLWGFGRGAIDKIVDNEFDVQVGPSEDIEKADYEAELRAILAEEHGPDAIGAVFPDHEQTRVHGRRD